HGAAGQAGGGRLRQGRQDPGAKDGAAPARAGPRAGAGRCRRAGVLDLLRPQRRQSARGPGAQIRGAHFGWSRIARRLARVCAAHRTQGRRMIGRLSGVLIEKRPPTLLVDAGGVGYEVDVPMSTFYGLPAIGERIILLTHQAVREDAHQLFGFATQAERGAFRALIKISGVGARTALAVLSGLSVDELA